MLPNGLCNQLDKAFKNFWWDFPKDKVRNLSLKSWKSLCLPKDHANLSLISKLGWKLLSNHDSLWASLFQTKYIKYGNFLSSSLSFGSKILNGIKATLPLLSIGACFIPQIHSSLPIWSSPWIPTNPKFLPIPRMSSIPSTHSLVIDDFIHPPTMSWKKNFQHFLFAPTTVSEILKIIIRPNSDFLLWTPSTSGVLSTKSVHHLISSFSLSHLSPLYQIFLKSSLEA